MYKRIVVLFCLLAPAVHAQVGGRVTVGTFASRPSSCSVGDLYGTSDTFLFYQCGPANTWVVVPSIDSANSFTGNNTHSGTETFTGPFSVSTPSSSSNSLSLLNPGAFGNTHMNEFLSSNLNSLNVGSLVSGLYGNYFTDAVSGACNGYTSTTVLQCNGVAGYAVTQTAMNAVGAFGLGKSAVAGGKAWGGNTLVTSTAGFASQNLNGFESDVNVQNTTDFGQALNCNGAWAAQSTNMNCIIVSKPSGGSGAYQWTNGILFSIGATPAATGNNGAIDLQPVSSAVNSVSQGITMVSEDPVSGTHVGVNYLDASGDIIWNVPSRLFEMAVTGTWATPVLTIGSTLPAASSNNAGQWATVNNSTAIATEGQTCTSGGTAYAAAFSNGSVWKCF